MLGSMGQVDSAGDDAALERFPPMRSFPGWTKTCADPRLCAAIVDRLTCNGTIVETGTRSYRLAHALARAVSRPVAR